MTSQKPEILTVSEIARGVDEWIIENAQGVMDRFQDQDTFFYDEYKAHEKELKQYEQKKRRITKKAFEDKDYQKLIDDRNKLSKNCNSQKKKVHDCESARLLSDRKLSFDSELTEDMIDDWDAKCKKRKSDEEEKLGGLLELLDKKQKQCTEKRTELKRKSDKKITKIKKPHPNPFDWLYLPPYHPDYISEHIAHTFGTDEKQPAQLKPKLALIADYMQLTIIYNKQIVDPRGALISKDIWGQDSIQVEVDYKWEKITKKQESPEVKKSLTESFERVKADIQEQGLLKKAEEQEDGKAAYIPFKKAIELSNGVLTRKKLNKAIEKRDPIHVRSHKPSKQRLDVHIQDVIALIEELSLSEKAAEKAAKMFGGYVKEFQKKRPQGNLE